MLNGLTVIPKAPAKFGGTLVAIEINAYLNLVRDWDSTDEMQWAMNYIHNGLIAQGWKVIKVSGSASANFGVQVIGNTSDNLSSVRVAFENSMAAIGMGLQLGRTTVGFVDYVPGGAGGSVTPPPISGSAGGYQPYESPVNTAPPPSGTPTFVGFTYVRQNGGYALYKENNTNDCYQLEGAELVYWGDCLAATKNKTLQSLEVFLAELGLKLDFSAKNALIGGAVVAGLALFLVVKNK